MLAISLYLADLKPDVFTHTTTTQKNKRKRKNPSCILAFHVSPSLFILLPVFASP